MTEYKSRKRMACIQNIKVASIWLDQYCSREHYILLANAVSIPFDDHINLEALEASESPCIVQIISE